jgi:hypothetical protein
MNKKMVIILIVIGVIVISFGLYTILPYFTNTVVNEPLPTASGLILSMIDIDNSVNEKV